MFVMVLTISLSSMIVASSELWFGAALTYGDANVSVSATPVHNLDTNMNYSTIQAAIDDSVTLNGHVISVDNGTYSEHVLVDKSLILKGESKENTTILWEGSGMALEATVNNVSLSGFRVQKSANVSTDGSCVFFNSSSGGSLTDCIVQYGYFGVFILESNSSLVANVTINGSGLGLGVINSSQSVFRDNEISDAAGIGVGLSGSTGCLLRNNHMTNCTGGFSEGGSVVEHFLNDIDTSNTIDGKLVYCLVNQTGLIVNPTTFPDAGSLTIANSTAVVVENLTLSHSGIGIALAYTNDSLIRNVAVVNNTQGYGINVASGTNNTISGCNVSDCFSGVSLAYAMNNTVRGNRISNSDHFGIYLLSAWLNTLVENDVINSSWTCVYMIDSVNNTLHHNNFVNYSEAYVYGSANSWDDGVEGNYWTSYTGADLNLDGIGDTPYVLGAYDVDQYPLMGMYHSYDAVIVPGTVGLVSNSTISDFALWMVIGYPETLTIEFKVSGESGFGFVRLRIPHDLIAGPYVVTVDGAEPVFANYSVLTQGNSAWIYFTYLHSAHVVAVVPEFSVLVLLPLLMGASLLAVAVRKRKRFR